MPAETPLAPEKKEQLKGKARRAFKVAMLGLAASALPLTAVRMATADEDKTPSATSAQAQPIVIPEEAPVIPLPPAPSIQEIISSDAEKARNIFFEENKQSISEFRHLRGDSTTTGTLTREELDVIAEIKTAAKEDAQTWQIPRAVAATLRFASMQADIDHDIFMNRLTQTGGIIAGGDRSGLQREALFKLNVPTWLYLVKQHGAEHGFGFFADRINMRETSYGTLLSVQDPNVLRQIISLRHNPRVSAIMGAEYMQNEINVPAKIGYDGADYRPNQQVVLDQVNMMILGYDLGIRGADGVAGPLHRAARAEFIQMSRPLFESGKTVSEMLEEAAAQAKIDSETYTTEHRPVTPADAFAIRHASKVIGVDYAYMMELVSAESSFITDVEASTSSATGLFQFIDNTWLLMLHEHGAKYGLADLAQKIEITQDNDGNNLANIPNPFLSKYALSLRADPRVSALMGAEFIKANFDHLQASFPDREITRTDQYLAHFLGSGKAVTFISRMERNGGQSAAGHSQFRSAARANRNVFYHRNGTPRSYQQIYDRFSQKFDTQEFDPPPRPTPNPRRTAPTIARR